MAHTKFSRLTDKELMATFENQRGFSPVLDELLTRLEALSPDLQGASISLPQDACVHCPICDAELNLSVNSDDKLTAEAQRQ